MYILKILRPVINYSSTCQSIERCFQSPPKSVVQHSKEHTISYKYEGQRYLIGNVTNSFECGRMPRTPYSKVSYVCQYDFVFLPVDCKVVTFKLYADTFPNNRCYRTVLRWYCFK